MSDTCLLFRLQLLSDSWTNVYVQNLSTPGSVLSVQTIIPMLALHTDSKFARIVLSTFDKMRFNTVLLFPIGKSHFKKVLWSFISDVLARQTKRTSLWDFFIAWSHWVPRQTGKEMLVDSHLIRARLLCEQRQAVQRQLDACLRYRIEYPADRWSSRLQAPWRNYSRKSKHWLTRRLSSLLFILYRDYKEETRWYRSDRWASMRRHTRPTGRYLGWSWLFVWLDSNGAKYFHLKVENCKIDPGMTAQVPWQQMRPWGGFKADFNKA